MHSVLLDNYKVWCYTQTMHATHCVRVLQMGKAKLASGEITADTTDKAYTAKQAAYIADCKIRWLYSRVGKEGGPPYKKRGRAIVFPKAEFDIWASQTVLP